MTGVTNLGGLLQAEWLRLRRRPEVLLLAALVPVAAGLLFTASFLDAIGHAGVGDGPPAPVPPEMLRLMARLREPYAFPQSLLAVLAGAWSIPLACLFLGAATVGADFGWGTIRTALLAWSDRSGWLVARLLSLAVVAASLLAAVLVVGALLPLLLTVAGEHLPAVDPPTGLLIVTGAYFMVAIQYAVLGIVGSLVARSLAGGFLLAGGYLLFDSIVAGLGVWSASGLRAVPAFSFSGSGRVLIEAANRVSGAPRPSTRTRPAFCRSPFQVGSASWSCSSGLRFSQRSHSCGSVVWTSQSSCQSATRPSRAEWGRTRRLIRPPSPVRAAIPLDPGA